MHFAKAGWFGCGLSCGCYFPAFAARRRTNAEILRYAQNDKPYSLLTVELDDELLVDGQVDVGAGGQGQYLARKVLAVDVQPLHGTLAAGKVARLFEHNQLFRALADRDLVAHLALEGRDVDLAAVYLDVP